MKLNIGVNTLETMAAILEYCKICTTWFPQMLTQEQKKTQNARQSGPIKPIGG